MTKVKQSKLGKGKPTEVKGKPPSGIPKQTLINWVKYYLKEREGKVKAKTQITSHAVDELQSRIESILESLVTYHEEHQVKQPNRRGNSIFEEDVVDFFDVWIRDFDF